ncbi:MAG TPA: hypothetical protein VMT56_02850, partial [Candidatus Bathyarchaeia archaeon]|nr:hypothetical protein [Candidatus Bathyarchaeia archaeon]
RLAQLVPDFGAHLGGDELPVWGLQRKGHLTLTSGLGIRQGGEFQGDFEFGVNGYGVEVLQGKGNGIRRRGG